MIDYLYSVSHIRKKDSGVSFLFFSCDVNSLIAASSGLWFDFLPDSFALDARSTPSSFFIVKIRLHHAYILITDAKNLSIFRILSGTSDAGEGRRAFFVVSSLAYSLWRS